MTATQFRRLLLFLFVPLILVGLWLADEEILLPHSTFTQCRLLNGRYICYTKQARRKAPGQDSFLLGGVWLQSAQMLDGLDAEVITEPGVEAGGVRKRLTLSNGNPPGKYGSCHLAVTTTPHVWYLACVGNGGPAGEMFRFADPAVDARYTTAYDDIRGDIARINEYNTRAYWASVLVPLAGFLLLSLASWLLLKVVRFVRGTQAPAGDST